MDHLVGEAAKIRWRTGGDWSCPMVLRTAYGGGFRGGPYHSQSVEAFYAHAPGLKVVAPSTPADAKGLLLAAIRDPDPVLVLEHKRTYRAIRGHVPEGDYVVPIGRAAVAREGRDATVLAYGMMLHESLAAAETLADEGIDVEVVDLRTLAPLDRETILASLAKTRRLCVVHEDTITMGLGAELCALAAEAGVLDVPPVRVAMPDIPGIPVDDVLEDAVLPNRATIRDALVRLVGRERTRSRRAAGALRAYDPAIPQASSIVEVALPEEHTRVAVDALVEAARAFPRCNATFAWTRDRRARGRRRRPRSRPGRAGARARHDHAGRLRRRRAAISRSRSCARGKPRRCASARCVTGARTSRARSITARSTAPTSGGSSPRSRQPPNEVAHPSTSSG